MHCAHLCREFRCAQAVCIVSVGVTAQVVCTVCTGGAVHSQCAVWLVHRVVHTGGAVHRWCAPCTEAQCTGGGESGHWPAAAAPPCSYSYNPTLLFIASTAAFYVPLLLPAGATCIGCKVKCSKVSEAKYSFFVCAHMKAKNIEKACCTKQ